MAILGNTEYFKGIGDIKFEGKNSDNPLALKYYNPDQDTYLTYEEWKALDNE